ncbi:hypothetical protein CCHOA_08085 [Corynebacterium choanae]|uniref:Uncharacterized protein n=1 Tax=Corynebacterium choanae TaxID=1862358 RepID=A0A3G6J7Y7_9CORY|nr:hypothetical protein CCHOA_08085 [Corynebacterium choanae]
MLASWQREAATGAGSLLEMPRQRGIQMDVRHDGAAWRRHRTESGL